MKAVGAGPLAAGQLRTYPSVMTSLNRPSASATLIKPLSVAVGATPFRLAPERADELNSEVFEGQAWEVLFADELIEKQTNVAAYPSGKRIEVHFSALLSIWAVSSAVLILASGAMRASRQGDRALVGGPDSDVGLARSLVEAAKALIRDKDTAWPDALPVPIENPAPDISDWYVNNLFLATTGWILLHEIAHIHLGHGRCATPEASFAQEYEADEWATDWIMRDAPADLTKDFRILAITTGLVWLAVLDNVRRGSTTHPHAWDRMQQLADRLSADELSPGLEMCSHVMKVLFLPDAEAKEFDCPEDAFIRTLIEVSRLDR